MEETKEVKILMVDDQPRNLLALRKWLEAPGRVLIEAQSGNEALGLILEHEFALILLDVQMPEMDGFETAELIRNNQESQTLPIIFVTGNSMEDQFVFQGYESGAVDYLLKPFNPTILQSKVQVFIELYQQRKNLEVEIATRKKIELELDKQRDWLEATLSSIADAVIATNLEGRIVFLNSPAETLCQWSAAEVKGKLLIDVLTIMDGERPMLNSSLLNKTLHEKVLTHFSSPSLTLLGKEKKNTPIDSRISPIFSKSGHVQGVVLAIRDLTQQKEAEAALEKSNTKLSEAQTTLLHVLSPREQEVLQMIVNGSPTKVIAIDLKLSERTVDAHRRNIMQKLQTHDLASLVRFAITHRLVSVN